MKRYIHCSSDITVDEYIKSIIPKVRTCGRAGYPETSGINVKVDRDGEQVTGELVGCDSAGTWFRVRIPNYDYRGRYLGYEESNYDVDDIVFDM